VSNDMLALLGSLPGMCGGLFAGAFISTALLDLDPFEVLTTVVPAGIAILLIVSVLGIWTGSRLVSTARERNKRKETP